jgi:peptide/nickel transport system substrate-binding protein/oligopeptide transport system substrate-binding protein
VRRAVHGKRLGLALAALLLIGLVFDGAVGPQTRGGTYRAVLGADPPTLDPAQATDTTSAAVIRQLFDGLLELDENLTLVPALAERWSVSKDQKVYVFALRKGARFHHGREVTAQDVKDSFERAARGKRPWVFEKLLGAPEFIRGQTREIRGIRVTNPGKVELALQKPFAPFPYLLAYDAAFIVPREVAEQRGAEFASRPVGTGAFRFVSWRRDDQVVLEAFPGHFRGAPYLERLVYRIIPQELTRLQEYRTGSLEHVDVPTGHHQAARRDPALSKELSTWPILGTYALRFTLTQPPFGKRELRQALNFAIDAKTIADVILEGSVIPAKGVLPPGMPGHDPSLPGYPFDRERARRLLAQAGFPGGQGLPPITLHYNVSDLHKRIAELAQAQLREVGVQVRLASLDWAAYIKLVDDGGTQWHRMGWIADYPDPENFLTVLFHSRNRGAPGNTSRYASPAVDRLLDEADALPLGPARLAKYREAERRIVEDAPWVFLYHYTSRLLLKPFVRGFERSAMSVAPEMQMTRMRNVWLER